MFDNFDIVLRIETIEGWAKRLRREAETVYDNKDERRALIGMAEDLEAEAKEWRWVTGLMTSG